jgi:CubicO group peptidase (beta-lactamase class C family)
LTDDPVTFPSASREDIALEAFVDGLVATWRFVHGAPGYTVSVVRPNRTVFAKGYGLADVGNAVPVDPERTRFYVASISKTFIWTAALMLVDQGVLELDRDVNDYLERYTVPNGERPLTLNDLMAHRGGFEENLMLFTPEVAAMDLPEAIAFTQPEQAFPRGEVAAYSNWGSNLVTLVIEDATGRSYEDFLFQEILEPLGMRATTLTDDSPAARSPDTPLSLNYRVTASGPEVVEQLDLGSFAPIGGMTTTAADMARWMRFHLGRGELDAVRLMSEATYAKLRTRAFDPVPGAAGRANGFADTPFRNITYYGHTGSINAFYSKFSMSPELGLGVFIAQNTSDNFDPLASVPQMVFERALQQSGATDVIIRPAPGDEDAAAAEALAGNYITSRRHFHGFLKILAALQGTVKLGASEGQVITPQAKAPYVQIAPDVWENRHGQRLAVVRRADGGVEHLIGSSGATVMIPVTPLTDPRLLAAALGATLLLTLTSWLGLWRRWRYKPEPTRTARLLTLLSLFGAVPVLAIIVIGASAPSPEEMSFAEIFSDWPLPFFARISMAATIAVAIAAIAALSLWPTWRSSGWSLWRKTHYSLFAIAYVGAGLLLVNWGLTLG